jgi:molybdenum cofactor biosynthesis enzyme
MVLGRTGNEMAKGNVMRAANTAGGISTKRDEEQEANQERKEGLK